MAFFNIVVTLIKQIFQSLHFSVFNFEDIRISKGGLHHMLTLDLYKRAIIYCYGSPYSLEPR